MSIDDLRVYATKDSPCSLMNKKFDAQPFSDFWIYLNHDQKSIIAQIVEQAILAEREACAAYCDRVAGLNAYTGAYNYANFASALARDIRAGVNRETGTPSNSPQDQSETPSPTIPTPES